MRKHRTKCAGSRGTSAIELMTVVGLIGVTAAFTLSSLQPYAEGYRLNGAAMSIASELSHARQDAVRTRLCHFFVANGSTQFRIVRDTAATPNCQLDAGDPILRTITLTTEHPNVSFSTGGATTTPYGGAVAGATPTNIRFEPRGVVTGTGGSTIFLDAPYSDPMAVTVTAAGSVRTWRLAAGSWQ